MSGAFNNEKVSPKKMDRLAARDLEDSLKAHLNLSPTNAPFKHAFSPLSTGFSKPLFITDN